MPGGSAADKALIDSAFALDLNGVKAALAKGADPNAEKIERSPAGNMISSPVLLSAILGQPSTSIQDAIQAGSTKDAETRAAIAKALFDAGAKFERLDIVGQSLLLSTPIELGNLALVELLIDHGASVSL